MLKKTKMYIAFLVLVGIFFSAGIIFILESNKEHEYSKSYDDIHASFVIDN